jgi:hypothetical protein
VFDDEVATSNGGDMKKESHSVGHWVTMGLVFVVGSLLLASSHCVPAPWDSMALHFGTAAVIAALLGMTIDFWLKKQIVTDVFQASIGYLLPKQFQDEMRTVYSQEFFCEAHNQDIDIQLIDSGLVRVTSRIERHIRNVSDETKSTGIGGGVEEWFEQTGASEISELGYQVEGQPRVELKPATLSKRSFDKGRPIIEAHSEKISIGANKSVIYWMTTIEIRSISSEHHAHFSYATRNPRVSVRASEGIEFAAHFPRETGSNKEQRSWGTFAFSGLVYPGQEIRVRWWEKAKADAWRGAL